MPLISKSSADSLVHAATGLALPFVLLAAIGSITTAKAGTACTLNEAGGMPNSPAAIERLLSNIKAEFSGGHILKVEQRSRDLEGLRLIYAVKVLPFDGRVAWLTFDACTLEPLTFQQGQAPHNAQQ